MDRHSRVLQRCCQHIGIHPLPTLFLLLLCQKQKSIINCCGFLFNDKIRKRICHWWRYNTFSLANFNISFHHPCFEYTEDITISEDISNIWADHKTQLQGGVWGNGILCLLLQCHYSLCFRLLHSWKQNRRTYRFRPWRWRRIRKASDEPRNLLLLLQNGNRWFRSTEYFWLGSDWTR